MPSPASFNPRQRDRWVEQMALKVPAGSLVLDVGAGEGRYRGLFGHCQYRAHDFQQYQGVHHGLLQQSWSYTTLDYVSDAAAIPVESGSFDAILCTEVLEHVPEPIRVIQEIGRLLRQGGQAFISAPLGAGLHQQPYHYYGGFTPHFYARFLPEAGLELTSITPNGRFFRLLLQELHRGVEILRSRRRFRPLTPGRLLMDLACSDWLARWLDRLDDEIPIDEFTVGYHVEARRS